MRVRGGQLKESSIGGDRLSNTTTERYRAVSKMALRGVRENMWGTLNGTNRSFTLSQYPYEWSLSVYRNGLLQDPADYTMVGKSVIFSVAPVSTDKIAATYTIGALASWNTLPSNGQLGNMMPCIIDSYGDVWGWGGNGNDVNGYVGDNTNASRSSPVSLPGYRRITYIWSAHSEWADASTYRTRWVTAIDENGMVWWWGQYYANKANYPADSATLGASSPVSIARPGSYSKCGLGWVIEASTGQVFTWGTFPYSLSAAYNGDNTTTARSSPVSIARPGSYTDVARIDGYTAFAIASDGTLWGWGVNTYGNVGDGTTANSSSPVSVLMAGVRSVRQHYTPAAYGMGGSCVHAIDSNGQIWGWGSNSNGKVGDGTTTDRSSPVSLARPGSYTMIATCPSGCAAIDGATGEIWCWGGYGFGLPGNGTTAVNSSPVSVVGGRSYVKVVGVQGCPTYNDSYGFFLAIDGATGMIYGWGQNTYGNLGDNTITFRYVPTPVARVASYRDIAVMYAYQRPTVYAVDAETNEVYAWGFNGAGWLGNGTTTDRSSPVSVSRVFY